MAGALASSMAGALASSMGGALASRELGKFTKYGIGMRDISRTVRPIATKLGGSLGDPNAVRFQYRPQMKKGRRPCERSAGLLIQ